MNSITQDIKYRPAILSYAEKHGVTKAAIKYRTYRQFIYRLRERYDGTPESLMPKSRRPHSHPNQHTEEEITLIKKMFRRNSHDGLVVFWVKLRRKGCRRSITGLFRCMRRNSPAKLENPKKKYKPKPCHNATFHGKKVQADVKVVPRACLAGQYAESGGKLYQYTAIDEYTRMRCLGASEEQSTYSSAVFLKKLVRYFPFPILKVQADNGTEFTKTFAKAKEGDLTLFEQQLKAYGIEHQKIRPYTPRNNGKVERSHRKDNEYFYARRTFYSPEDFERQLRVLNRQYNNFPMRPLNWKSPRETLDSFLQNL